MNKESATQYFEQGNELLSKKKLEEAVQCFAKAIELDPSYSEAFLSRGEVYTMLGKSDEAAADIRQAKALLYEQGSSSRHSVDMSTVDNLYDDLTAYGEDEVDFDDETYDSLFADESAESDSLLDSLSVPPSTHTGYPAILEYLDGTLEEVPWTRLFDPTEDELTLVHEEGDKGRIISLEQLSCVRLARIPAGYPKNKDSNCHVEIIETIDGNIFHESIHPVQNQRNVLFGFSTKKDTRFKYTLIPLQNIKKRFQRRHLGQILVDNGLVTGDILQNVLKEHNDLKKIKFGRVIAEQAKLLYSAVENEIQRAYENTNQELKIGEILLNAGLVSEEQIDQALAYQKRLQNRKLGHFLIEKGILQEKDLYMALSEKFRIPFVDIRKQKGSKKVISLLPSQLIQKLKVLPLSVKDNKLVIATILPDPAAICEVILRHCPLKDIDFVLAQPSHLNKVINILFPPKE